MVFVTVGANRELTLKFLALKKLVFPPLKVLPKNVFTFLIFNLSKFSVRTLQYFFFPKILNSFGCENCDQLVYLDTLPSSLSLIKVAPWLL